MGRKKMLPNTVVISIRLNEDDWNRVREIAALETLNTGRVVSSHELIRQAIKFVYDDNERLRESFRRAKRAAQSGYKRSCS
jgi:hypothetical protein